MEYMKLRNKQAKELDAFPIAFAFNQRQLNEGLAKLGISMSEALHVPGGGLIRKTDKQALLDLFKRHEQESEAALQNDNFLLDAIEYELANHEFCITGDPEPALSAVGVSLADERIVRLFQIAKRNYITRVEIDGASRLTGVITVDDTYYE